MHSVLVSFQKDAEKLLEQIVPEAMLYFEDDEAGYFQWLQKASVLKNFKPDISNDKLHPKMMARPLNQTFKDALKK